MLLDELFAERERVPIVPTPTPVLTVDPVAVPSTIETGRRAVRQRLAELESAARRNYRSAEEARRVLAEEHQRLQQEATARTHAQQEAAALRAELDRLSTEEARRSAQDRTRAERAARAQVADELEQFQLEHERVVQEMTGLRSSLSEHDGLLDEYVMRLRDEQTAREGLRAELERAEAARSLAERSLQRATESARHGAEDEMIRLATAEQQLADASSDRDRFAAQLAELTAGDGPIGRMTTQLEERDAEISRLGVRIADLSARIEASEDAAADALSQRDDALDACSGAEQRLQEAERARADAELAAGAAEVRVGELESALEERIEATDVRARELDRTLGKLRREARDASGACRKAEGELATILVERDELRARVADAEAESVRARADGDRLRAHAAVLGDELAVARATVAELGAALRRHRSRVVGPDPRPPVLGPKPRPRPRPVPSRSALRSLRRKSNRRRSRPDPKPPARKSPARKSLRPKPLGRRPPGRRPPRPSGPRARSGVPRWPNSRHSRPAAATTSVSAGAERPAGSETQHRIREYFA